eukprot:SAG31_NODE_1575_length_7841_cov_3.083958_5_plen_125_part_00
MQRLSETGNGQRGATARGMPGVRLTSLQALLCAYAASGGKECYFLVLMGFFPAESRIYAPRNRLLLSRFHGTFRAESPMYAPRNPGLIEKVPPRRARRLAREHGGGHSSSSPITIDSRSRCPAR